jgi:hypothetical protein
VRILWRAHEYERTYADCDYAWRVPRSAVHKPISAFGLARGRPVTLGGLDPVVVDSEPEIAASGAIGEVAAAYAECPKCGAEHYTQRPVRS